MSNCECNHCKSEAKCAKYRQERGFWAVLRMDSPSDRFDASNQYLNEQR